MKTKVAFLGLLAVPLVFWGIWSYAYHRGFDRGYSQGSGDEFLCWKQEPTRVDSSWDRFVTGRRDMRKPLGGKPLPTAPTSVNGRRELSVNRIPSTFSP